MEIKVDISIEAILANSAPTVGQVIEESIILNGIHDRDKHKDLVKHLIDVVMHVQMLNIKRGIVL